MITPQTFTLITPLKIQTHTKKWVYSQRKVVMKLGPKGVCSLEVWGRNTDTGDKTRSAWVLIGGDGRSTWASYVWVHGIIGRIIGVDSDKRKWWAYAELVGKKPTVAQMKILQKQYLAEVL